jgi:hypothetical protein
MERRQKPRAKQNVNRVSGKRRAVAIGESPKAHRRPSAVKIKANNVMTETQTPVLSPARAAALEKAAKQELVAPHEWATLLKSPDNEAADIASGAPIPEVPHTEAASDDLWERLSSTRWIKVAPEHDLHNRSTVANRPSK